MRTATKKAVVSLEERLHAHLARLQALQAETDALLDEVTHAQQQYQRRCTSDGTALPFVNLRQELELRGRGLCSCRSLEWAVEGLKDTIRAASP